VRLLFNTKGNCRLAGFLTRKTMRNFQLGIIAIVVLAACAQEHEPSEPVVDIDAGKAIAEASCAACHGLDGRGETGDIPNLAAQPVKYLVDALNAYKDGRRHHAALQDLASGMSSADIRNIAAYYSSLPPLETIPPVEVPQPDSSFYEEGAEVAAICAGCHGEHGYSTTPGIPSLAGQQPAYLIVSTQEYARGNRGHQEKEAMLQGLDQVDIEKMAVYFASQLPIVREAPSFGDPVRGEPLSAGCGECHGARGISHDPLVPSLAGQEPLYLVNAIKAYRGKERQHEDMMTDKSDAEIEDIAAFYAVQRAEPAGDQPVVAPEMAATCERCHGPIVGTSTMVVPSLKGQNRDYLVRVMKAYRDDDRGNSMMHKMSANYSDEMIEAIAAYYANQQAD
jgi:cytochrome c553